MRKMMDYPGNIRPCSKDGGKSGPGRFRRRYDQPCMEWWALLRLLSQKVVRYRTYLSRFSVPSRFVPKMGTLTEASATVDTHFGKIEVSLEKTQR